MENSMQIMIVPSNLIYLNVIDKLGTFEVETSKWPKRQYHTLSSCQDPRIPLLLLPSIQRTNGNVHSLNATKQATMRCDLLPCLLYVSLFSKPRHLFYWAPMLCLGALETLSCPLYSLGKSNGDFSPK